jgi:preprotein translocase subunit YajC
MLSKASGMRSCGFVATCVAVVFVGAFVQSAIAQDETPAAAPATAAADQEGPADPNDAAANQPEAPSMTDMLVPIIGMGLIFYFIVLSPQKKAKKKQQAVVDSLQKHDRVVSIGGIIGTIVSFDTSSDEVVLEVAPEMHLRILRRSIQGPKPLGTDEDGAGKAMAEK